MLLLEKLSKLLVGSHVRNFRNFFLPRDSLKNIRGVFLHFNFLSLIWILLLLLLLNAGSLVDKLRVQSLFLFILAVASVFGSKSKLLFPLTVLNGLFYFVDRHLLSLY